MILLIFAAISLDTILNRPELTDAHYGIYIQRLDNNQVLYNYNGNKVLIPASNLKLVTTAAALSILGKRFCYRTYLGYRGIIENGELRGDLVLIGGGDPTLRLDSLDRFIRTMGRLGIDKVKGNIVVVDDYFTDERLPVGWSWHYLDAKYAPEISALSINNNCVNVIMQSTAVGEYADVGIEPATGYIKLYSQMKTIAGRDSIIIYRKPEANVIYVDGGIRADHRRGIEVAVKDPAMYAGSLFKERLADSNRFVYGNVLRNNSIRADTANLLLIDSLASPPMVEIVKQTNRESENLYAEVLLKTMGAEKMQAGSFAAGISAVKKFLEGCTIESTKVALADGSGLSKHNLISPRSIVRVLKFMYGDTLFKDYYDSFATPGKGTLEYRFDGFKDSLHAKTGAIHAVSCLSGYLSVNGIDCCFSLMFNNYTCGLKKIMDIQEKVINALADYLKTGQPSQRD